MKITSFSMLVKDIRYGSDNSCYSAVVNNHTDETEDMVLSLAAEVLYEMYYAEKEKSHERKIKK